LREFLDPALVDNYLLKETAYKPVNPVWPPIAAFFKEMTLGYHQPIGSSAELQLPAMRCLMSRTCSQPADEALVFTALITKTSGSASRLLAVPPEDRYKALFHRLGDVPTDIIFIDQARYPDYGSRWIPRSMLSQSSAQARPLTYRSSDYGAWGIPGKDGLTASFPGFDLQLRADEALPARFLLRLAGTMYSAFLHEGGSMEGLDGVLKGPLIIITDFMVWVGAESVLAIVVSPLSSSWWTENLVRHEAIVDLLRVEEGVGVGREQAGLVVLDTEQNALLRCHVGEPTSGNRWRIG
jgi:hypothetical protein